MDLNDEWSIGKAIAIASLNYAGIPTAWSVLEFYQGDRFLLTCKTDPIAQHLLDNALTILGKLPGAVIELSVEENGHSRAVGTCQKQRFQPPAEFGYLLPGQDGLVHNESTNDRIKVRVLELMPDQTGIWWSQVYLFDAREISWVRSHQITSQ